MAVVTYFLLYSLFLVTEARYSIYTTLSFHSLLRLRIRSLIFSQSFTLLIISFLLDQSLRVYLIPFSVFIISWKSWFRSVSHCWSYNCFVLHSTSYFCIYVSVYLYFTVQTSCRFVGFLYSIHWILFPCLPESQVHHLHNLFDTHF